MTKIAALLALLSLGCSSAEDFRQSVHAASVRGEYWAAVVNSMDCEHVGSVRNDDGYFYAECLQDDGSPDHN